MDINLQLRLEELPAAYQALISAGYTAMDEAKAERGFEAKWRVARDEAETTADRTNAETEIRLARLAADAAEARAQRYLDLAQRASAVAKAHGVNTDISRVAPR